jgi:DNA (cytosine-5)-methyltransferase 1
MGGGEGRTFVDWFAGIGSGRLGFERAGWRCVWACECDPDARAVYRARFGAAPAAYDLTAVRPDDVPHAECWLAGFPCQDISSARTRDARRGLDGAASGLWHVLVELLAAAARPRWLVIENSPEWRAWVPVVRADLARLGFATVPVVLSASTFGAPHARPRGFVVADANGESEPLRALYASVARLSTISRPAWPAFPARDLGMDDGSTARMVRLRLLGNGMVVPCIEWLAAQLGLAPAQGGL